jgi:hypothetical protein
MGPRNAGTAKEQHLLPGFRSSFSAKLWRRLCPARNPEERLRQLASPPHARSTLSTSGRPSSAAVYLQVETGLMGGKSGFSGGKMACMPVLHAQPEVLHATARSRSACQAPAPIPTVGCVWSTPFPFPCPRATRVYARWGGQAIGCSPVGVRPKRQDPSGSVSVITLHRPGQPVLNVHRWRRWVVGTMLHVVCIVKGGV